MGAGRFHVRCDSKRALKMRSEDGDVEQNNGSLPRWRRGLCRSVPSWLMVSLILSVITGSVWVVWLSGFAFSGISHPINHTIGYPARILSVNVTGDEVLLALAPERVVGLSVLADNPDSSNIVQEAGAIPVRVPGDIEHILMLAPDLVVIGAHSADLARQVDGLGIGVFRIHGFESIEWIRSLIRALGKTAGARDRAEQLVGAMNDRIADVSRRVANRPRPRVLLYSESGWVGGRHTTLDDVIQAAGGINVAGELGVTGWSNISQEEVVLADPEVILLRDARKWESGSLKALLKNPAFQKVKALRDHRVHAVPSRLLVTSSHHIADTVEAIARLLHPEMFEEGPR